MLGCIKKKIGGQCGKIHFCYILKYLNSHSGNTELKVTFNVSSSYEDFIFLKVKGNRVAV